MIRPSRLPAASAFLIVALHLFVAVTATAQDDFYHPELNWHVIETAHFKVTYHDGAERTAKVVSVIAEEIYQPVTSLYRHEPDEKVSFVIKDYDDISNGAAYFYENKIEIYAPSMDFELRGTHNWLRNVITHEFTHIVQIQTSMKFGRKVPAIYLQWLGYESERRVLRLVGKVAKGHQGALRRRVPGRRQQDQQQEGNEPLFHFPPLMLDMKWSTILSGVSPYLVG